MLNNKFLLLLLLGFLSIHYALFKYANPHSSIQQEKNYLGKIQTPTTHMNVDKYEDTRLANQVSNNNESTLSYKNLTKMSLKIDQLTLQVKALNETVNTIQYTLNPMSKPLTDEDIAQRDNALVSFKNKVDDILLSGKFTTLDEREIMENYAVFIAPEEFHSLMDEINIALENGTLRMKME